MKIAKMSTLEDRRKEALEADKCFSKGTLKEEYRMKPGPDVQPVKYYKDRFGGSYGVYKIADCVPMREKKPVTEKQVMAGKKLAARSRLTSKKGKAMLKAKEWLAADVLVLDTETTGVEFGDEVIELAVIDVSGRVLFETKLRPTVDIHPEAFAVHEICIHDLDDAPTWPDIAPRLKALLDGRDVVAFNSEFDTRLLAQTAEAFGDDLGAWTFKEHCAMALAVQAFSERANQRYRSISLANAIDEAGVEWQGQAHSAVGDALTTLALVKAIADTYKNEDAAISFSHNGTLYKDVYLAKLYVEYDDLELRTTQGFDFSYTIREGIPDLLEKLESLNIQLLRC
jgi:DNA polymerase III epsilon subunit-like protein